MKKLHYILPFITLIVIVTLGINSRTDSYELSVYTSSTPVFFWVLISAVIIYGIYRCVRDINSKWAWLYPIGLLLACSLIVLALPLLKGYWCANRNDMMIHIGLARDLANYGIKASNSYPLVHVLPAALIKMGIAPNVAVGVMPSFICLASFTSIGLLAYSVLSDRRAVIVALMCGSLLFLPSSGLYSSSVAFSTVFLLALGAAVFMARYGLKYYYVIIGLGIIALIIFAGIYLMVYRPTIGLDIQQAVSDNVYPIPALTEQVSPFETVIDNAQKAGMGWLAVSWLIFKTYGGEMIFGGMGLLACALMIKREMKYYRFMAGVYVFVVLVYWLNFFGYVPMFFRMQSEYITRFIYIICPIAIVLTASLLVRVITIGGYQRSVVIVSLIAVALLSVFNAFPSPWIFRPNTMVSQHEIAGASWLIDNKIKYAPVAYVGVPMRQYAEALHGRIWWIVHRWEVSGKSSKEAALLCKNHFGYDQSDTIQGQYHVKTYIVYSSYDRLLYDKVWKYPVPARWSGDDYMRLKADPAVKLICSTGDFEAVLVEP